MRPDRADRTGRFLRARTEISGYSGHESVHDLEKRIHVFRCIALMSRHANSAGSLKSGQALAAHAGLRHGGLFLVFCAPYVTPWATRAIRYLSDLCCRVPSMVAYLRYIINILLTFQWRTVYDLRSEPRSALGGSYVSC